MTHGLFFTIVGAFTIDMIIPRWLTFCTALVLLAACSSWQDGGLRGKRNDRRNHNPVVVKVYHNGSHSKLGKIPDSDIPLQVNKRVLQWVKYFTETPGSRARFARYLARSGRYIDLMHKELARQGMPRDLVYLALIESGFRNKARSHAAAVGTWQFIRSTGRRYGLRVNNWVDERHDPEKAVHAAASYLRDLYDEFGDWYLSMAAYNAGEGRIRRDLANTGAKDFWELINSRDSTLRQETKDYVPKYIAATIIAKSPRRFGFKGIEYHDPLRYDTAVVHGQADIATIAKAAGVATRVVEELNPELLAGVTPPGKYTVKLPVGISDGFDRRVAKLMKTRKQSIPRKHGVKAFASYRVRRGDTVGQIARRYRVSAKRLMAINRIKSPRRLRKGVLLKIPGRSRDDMARVVVASRGTSAVGRPTVVNRQGKITPAEMGRERKALRSTYRVKHGDTLSTIARNNGVTIRDLRAWNNIDGNRIVVGQKLKLGHDSRHQTRGTAQVAVAQAKRQRGLSERAATTKSVGAKSFSTYVVRRGDALVKIAQLYGMKTSELREMNGLGRNALIRVGQRLRVAKKIGSGDIRQKMVADRRKPSQAAPAGIETSLYRVRSGDTLAGIAQRNGMTIKQLRQMNGLSGRAIIRVGQKMRVAGKKAVLPKRAIWAEKLNLKAIPTRKIIHQVKSGDTLWDISNLYQVKPEEIQRWNNMSDPVIKPGQRLTIRTNG